jgi:hypothetical protein
LSKQKSDHRRIRRQWRSSHRNARELIAHIHNRQLGCLSQIKAKGKPRCSLLKISMQLTYRMHRDRSFDRFRHPIFNIHGACCHSHWNWIVCGGVVRDLQYYRQENNPMNLNLIGFVSKL